MRALVLDTETTGLNPYEHRVIELCIADLDTGQVLSHSHYDPGCKLPEFITELTGITQEMVDRAPPFSIDAEFVADLIRNAEVVIGSNPSFDRGMITAEFKRVEGLVLPSWPTLICTRRVWNRFEPPEKRGLENAYKRFVNKNGFSGAHGAMADTLAAREVILAQMREYGFDRDWNALDPEQKSWWGGSEHVIWKNDRLVLNFGKNKGVHVHEIDVGFWKWLSGPDRDFPEHVKTLADYMIHCYQGETALITWAKGAKI